MAIRHRSGGIRRSENHILNRCLPVFLLRTRLAWRFRRLEFRGAEILHDPHLPAQFTKTDRPVHNRANVARSRTEPAGQDDAKNKSGCFVQTSAILPKFAQEERKYRKYLKFEVRTLATISQLAWLIPAFRCPARRAVARGFPVRFAEYPIEGSHAFQEHILSNERVAESIWKRGRTLELAMPAKPSLPVPVNLMKVDSTARRFAGGSDKSITNRL